MSDSTRGQHTGAWIGAGATIAAPVIGTLLTVFLTMRSDDGGAGGNDPEIPQQTGARTRCGTLIDHRQTGGFLPRCGPTNRDSPMIDLLATCRVGSADYSVGLP